MCRRTRWQIVDNGALCGLLAYPPIFVAPTQPGQVVMAQPVPQVAPVAVATLYNL